VPFLLTGNNKELRGKVEAGEYPHRPPYGYKIGEGPNGSRLPVPEPEKADTVRTIFALMASGKYSIDTLRQELFQRGMYFSPRTQRWKRSHLAKLLRHPFYIGRILWRGQVYEGKHEPIVDQRVWQQVQKVLDGHDHSRHAEQRQFTYGHGLIKCAHCGYNITAEIHKQRYIYYICSQRRHRVHSVKLAWVREQVIESQIIAMLEKLCLPKEVYDWATSYLKNILARDRADTENELRRLKRKQSETQAALDAILLRAAEADDDLADGFMRLAKLKQQEVTLLQRRIAEVQQGKYDNSGDPAKIIELTQDLARQYVTFPLPQKQQIVQSVFSNLELDDVSLCGDYRLPFSILAENARRPLKCA